MLRNWLALGAACFATGCTRAGTENDARQDARVEAIVAGISSNLNAQEAKLKELEARVAALEDDKSQVSTAASTGAWIAWKVEQISTNPQGVLVSPARPQPMHAFSSQAECIAESNRVAKASGGDPNTPAQYLRNGSFDTIWLVSFRCLPKEIDPRR